MVFFCGKSTAIQQSCIQNRGAIQNRCQQLTTSCQLDSETTFQPTVPISKLITSVSGPQQWPTIGYRKQHVIFFPNHDTTVGRIAHSSAISISPIARHCSPLSTFHESRQKLAAPTFKSQKSSTPPTRCHFCVHLVGSRPPELDFSRSPYML